MKIKMIATNLVSVISHEGTEYRPNKNGEFDVDERHVAALRSHSLILLSEAHRGAPRTASETIAAITKENEELKKKLNNATKT